MIFSLAFLVYRQWLSVYTHRWPATIGAVASSWMDIRLPDPTMTTTLLGIESPRDTLTPSAIQFLEDAASSIGMVRRHATWRSSMRRLRGSFSGTKIPLENTSASSALVPSANTKSWALPKTPAI